MRADNVVESTRSEKGTVMPGHCKNEGAEFRMVIGSKGSLVILLRDPYQENAIKDHPRLGRQSELQSRSVRRQPISAAAGRESSVFKAESIAITAGGISMHGYDVKGLNMTRGPLYECYRSDKNDTDSPASRLTSFKVTCELFS
jgi:hypothetical protein